MQGIARLVWVPDMFQDGNLIHVHKCLSQLSGENEIATGFGQPTEPTKAIAMTIRFDILV